MAVTRLKEVTIAILGPSDINPMVDKVKEYIDDYEAVWNSVSKDCQIHLKARRYNSEVPVFRTGWSGQDFVDADLLSQADIAVVLFRGTVGTPYEDPRTHTRYVSATDYEITCLKQRYEREGKPAIHVFFPMDYTAEKTDLLVYRRKLGERGSGFMLGEWDSGNGNGAERVLKGKINDLLQKDLKNILRNLDTTDAGVEARKKTSPVSLPDDLTRRAAEILSVIPGLDGAPGERITQPEAVKNLNDGGVRWRELGFDKAAQMICILKERGVIEFDGERGGQPTIRVAGASKEREIATKEPEIRRFAYLNWDEVLPQLEKLALPEMWGFGPDPDDCDILRNYLTYTFERAKIESKVLVTKSSTTATFNTGLISREGHDIYMKFEPNRHPYLKWRFWRFEEIPYGSGLLGNALSNLPGRPSYGDEPDFHFDTNLEIRMSVDKIIQSALNRLPIAYLREIAEHNDELLAELGSRRPDWKIVSELVASDRAVCGYLQNDLNSVRKNVRAMARANPRLPVPFYYPKDRKIEFLLPLDLDWDPSDWSIGERTKMRPQAALVLERQERNNDAFYQVHGLLDLRKAYIDARLLGRQDDTWLDAETLFHRIL